MKPLDRNISILEHIIAYCDQISAVLDRTTMFFLQMPSTETRQPCASCKSENSPES